MTTSKGLEPKNAFKILAFKTSTELLNLDNLGNNT